MPIFQFNFGPPTAGCVAKVVVKTPWNRPVKEQPSQVYPQGRVLQPVEAAYAWLAAFGAQRDGYGNPRLLFPPQAQCQAQPLGPDDGEATILAVEPYPATVDRQPVTAPYGMPVGNGHSMAPPPQLPPPNAQRVVPQGMYEELGDCALANTTDPLMGEMDGLGGTYTDVDSMGREVIRQIAMPPSPKVTDR